MTEHVNIFEWQHSLLTYKRLNVKRFDIGQVILPFRCELVPWSRGEAMGSVALGTSFLAGGAWFLWLPFDIGLGVGRGAFLWGLGLLLAGAGMLFVFSGITSRRRQGEIRIDREWVEVTDRPLFKPPLRWREPLSNYTGVRCHVVRSKMHAYGNGTVKLASYAIDLDHPNEDRIVPLYRDNRDHDVERRWTEFADALGLPKTGSFKDGLVTSSVHGIPLGR